MIFEGTGTLVIDNSEKCEKICKKFLTFEGLWSPSQCDLDNFKLKKIYFYQFHQFLRVFGRFLSFEGIWWPSQCDLDNFQSKKEISDSPISPIIESFGRFFFD